jgi:hypothetical protein
VTPGQLVAGQVYFKVCYEDEDLNRMVIQSYEYLGRQEPSALESGEKAYRFRPMDPFSTDDDATPYDGEFEFTEKTLQSLCDLASLIDLLQRIQRKGPGRAWAPDAS